MIKYKNNHEFIDLIWSLFLCIVMVSCSSKNKSESEIKFEKLFPDVNFNNYIKQTVVRNEINQNIGSGIYLLLENLSSSKIVFPDDYGVKVFTYSMDNDQWEEIKNDGTYIAETTPILYPKEKGSLKFLGVPLFPVVEKGNRDIDIRIVVVGTVYTGDVSTGERVGSYTDLTLTPK